MPDFGKWWDDRKKHKKRIKHWLPHIKKLSARVGDGRSIRYFTLCARAMIDIFMLVKEGILPVDPDGNSIGSVQFCECEADCFAEIKDLIGREDAGFFGYLEKVVLFEDDDFTGQCPSRESIERRLEDGRLTETQVDRLQLKRTFLDVKESFPYDYINLDFCEYYYPAPDMLQINKTVEKILEWQRMTGVDGQSVAVDEFLLAVTCKHDEKFPAPAEARLTSLIQENCDNNPAYKSAILTSRNVTNVDTWRKADKEDFFFAGWPKDIARSARDRHWSTEILDYCYYRREDSAGEKYVITCAVFRFARVNVRPEYIGAAMHALSKDNRIYIDEIDASSPEGKRLRTSLRGIVKVRNAKAKVVERPELPMP